MSRHQAELAARAGDWSAFAACAACGAVEGGGCRALSRHLPRDQRPVKLRPCTGRPRIGDAPVTPPRSTRPARESVSPVAPAAHRPLVRGADR